MSARTDTDHLRDMLRYAEEGHALVQGRDPADLEAKKTLRYSLQYCILIVGEAASRVSPETQSRLPNIP